MSAPAEHRVIEVVQIYKGLPARHVALPLTVDDWGPLYREGESVVLDASDVDPREGRHYGLVREDGETVIVEPSALGPDMIRVRLNSADEGQPVRVRLVPHDVWRLVCRGRVVGILWPPSLDGGAL